MEFYLNSTGGHICSSRIDGEQGNVQDLSQLILTMAECQH